MQKVFFSFYRIHAWVHFFYTAISEEAKKIIVDETNKLRSAVQPTATNMLKVVCISFLFFHTCKALKAGNVTVTVQIQIFISRSECLLQSYPMHNEYCKNEYLKRVGNKNNNRNKNMYKIIFDFLNGPLCPYMVIYCYGHKKLG